MNKAKLGIFSLGISFSLYFVLQNLVVPILWFFAQTFKSFAWMNDVFIYFEKAGQTIFSSESVTYSVFALIAFGLGFVILPRKAARIQSPFLTKSWDFKRAESIFWMFFVGGFLLKFIKVVMNLDFVGPTGTSVPKTILGDGLVALFLSLNMLHTMAVAVINIAYQEAKSINDPFKNRLRWLCYSTNSFVVFTSLFSNSLNATVFMLFTLAIIRQFYSPMRKSTMIWGIGVGLPLLLIYKYMVKRILIGESLSGFDFSEIRFSLFYMLFYRVNLSYVFAAVVEKGMGAYPGGTLGQFWTEMTLYGSERVNVFDGNVFGRALGLASPGDYVTGVAATNIGDYYINFGIVGVLLGMFLAGFFYKIFYSTCSITKPVLVLMYSLIWPILIHGLESPITVLYATVLKTIMWCLFIQFAIVIRFHVFPNRQISTKFTESVPSP